MFSSLGWSTDQRMSKPFFCIGKLEGELYTILGNSPTEKESKRATRTTSPPNLILTSVITAQNQHAGWLVVPSPWPLLKHQTLFHEKQFQILPFLRNGIVSTNCDFADFPP